MNPNGEVSRRWEARFSPYQDHGGLPISAEASRIVRYQASQPQRARKISTSACCPASLILPIITWIEVGDLSVSDLQLESCIQRLYISLVFLQSNAKGLWVHKNQVSKKGLLLL